MSGLTGLIRRHRLVSFFVLAYAIAWGPWPLYAAGVLPEAMFLPIAPLVAAVVVAWVADGGAGLRDLGSRMIRWRVPVRWYVIALGVPLAVIAVTFAVNVAMGAPAPKLSSLAWSSFVLVFAVRMVNPMDGALGEEPGWRGFAIPRLQKTRSPLVSATILGALVAIWHLPLVVNAQGDVGYIGLPTTFAVTFFYYWLFNRTGGSALLTLLAHSMQGTVTVGSFGFAAADVARMEYLGFVAWAAIAVCLVVLDRKAWRVAPPEAVYPPSAAVPATPHAVSA
jgi:membrane protease YdiL (CAAX protease family)